MGEISKTARFMGMYSGGHLKTSFTHIYIDVPLMKRNLGCK